MHMVLVQYIVSQVLSQEVFATQTAFAALRSTGDVVVWGDAQCGGDARAVQERPLKKQAAYMAGARAGFHTLH